MTQPLFSILIDTYNHERFIEKAIASVLEQNFPSANMEILVVDDGSTDRTAEIVRKFEPRVRLIRKANGGQASAFNVGIAQAQGEIVAFLDGDDWWAPHKLREVGDTFEKNPDVGVVGHGYYAVHLDAQKNEQVVPERIYRLTLNDLVGASYLESICDLFATSRLVVRKKVLDRILPVPEELFFAADGYIFVLAIAIAGAIILDRPLCYYRLHGGNLWETNDPGRMQRRHEMLERVLEGVIPRLSGLGFSHEEVAALTGPYRVEIERSRLIREGGMPWRTFQLEWAAHRSAHAETSFGYKVFKTLVLGLALLMPPRRFYQLKQWYAERGLRRYREKVGDVVLPPELVQIRCERVSIEKGNLQ